MTNRPDAEELYAAMLNGKRLTQVRRLTYRCQAKHCLLLDVVETPVGIVLHQKRFKHSLGESLARSNEAGRARNTYDGQRHWKPRTYYLEQSALSIADQADPQPTQGLWCDHVLEYLLTAPEFQRDWQARDTPIIVTADGRRYALS